MEEIVFVAKITLLEGLIKSAEENGEEAMKIILEDIVNDLEILFVLESD